MAKKSAASKAKSTPSTTAAVPAGEPPLHAATRLTRRELILPSRAEEALSPAPSTSALAELSSEADSVPPTLLTAKEKVPQVNTASLAELKNTCDDVVKEVSLSADLCYVSGLMVGRVDCSSSADRPLSTARMFTRTFGYRSAGSRW